jgi:hypothetical protein
MEVRVESKTLLLIKDHGRISMEDALKQLGQDHKDNPPTTLAEVHSSIDSIIMIKCIKKSLDSSVSTKLLKQEAAIFYQL